MNNAVVYLFIRLAGDIGNAVRHWYGDSFVKVWEAAVNILERLDAQLALRITLRYFFRPLYGDASIPGRIFGFFLRTARIVIAVFLYLIVIIAAVFSYLIFALLPLFIIYLGLSPASR